MAVVPDGATADVTKFLDANVHSCCTGLNAAVSRRTGPRPARPARPTTTPTRGSAATRPNIAACVWVGYPRGEIAMDLGGPIPGPAFGGGYPATIWSRFATRGLRRRADEVPADAVAGPEALHHLPAVALAQLHASHAQAAQEHEGRQADERRWRRELGRRHHHRRPADDDPVTP